VQGNDGVLPVEPYNDFLSEGGEVWPRVKETALEVKLLDNLRAIRGAMRRAGLIEAAIAVGYFDARRVSHVA
jgi:hypothetical protein